MKIYRTLCPNCGEEMDNLIVFDYHFECPICHKHVSYELAKRRQIHIY